MHHPYRDLPARAFWRTAVAGAADLQDLYHPRFPLTRQTRIASFGSCFAQHIMDHLRRANCNVHDCEPAPQAMPAAVARRFGYGQFSARSGNIYATRHLLDLLADAASGTAGPECVWPLADRFVDAFRPSVEPDGLDSPAEVILHRRRHLTRLAGMLRQTDVLIFTLGLTEVWMDNVLDRALPVCPGVRAGRFDPGRHHLVTLTCAQVLDDLQRIHALLQRFRPGMRLLLTVSPVPLTATAGGGHVLTASTAAKATLRAAIEAFLPTPDVDYVPSYEVLTHPAWGNWFAPNGRTIRADGVDRVMSMFLAAHGLDVGADETGSTTLAPAPSRADNCDDILLDAFSPVRATL